MPKLKYLLCSIEHADSNIPFREYGTSYGDGFVQTHIVAPPTPIPFTLHLSSTGYIAPGLAMFVFMDGVYQCNRNIDGLVPPSEATDMSQTKTEFRVRQKEQMLNNDTWIGREWRFEEFNIVTGEAQPHTAAPSVAHLGSLGLIEVVILRCLNSADPMMAPPLHVPPTAPSNRDKPWTLRLEPSPSALGGLFFDGAGDSYILKPTSFSLGGIEDQSTRSESKTVRFGEGEGWGYSYTGPSTGTWHAMDGSYDRNYRRVFHPETWDRRTEAYEHYSKDWQNPNGQRDETRGRDIHRDGRNRQQDSFNLNRPHPSAINNRRPRTRPEGNGRAQHPSIPTSRWPPIYHPPRLSPRRLQRHRRQNRYPASEVEASARYEDGYTTEDQYYRSGYVDNCGNWVGGEFGSPRFGRTDDSLLEPRPPDPPGTLQDGPTDPGHWKARPGYNDRNSVYDARATPQGGGDDIGKYSGHRSDAANTWKNCAGPDVGTWVIRGGSGTWEPPAANDTDLHRINLEERNALDPPTAKAKSDITHVGQGARRGGQTNDANRSNQAGGRNARSSRENSRTGGDRKTDGNNNANENASKRGGSKSNGRGRNEKNSNGEREIDNKGNQNRSGISGANRNTSRRGSRLNERGYHDGNWNGGGENDDCYHQRNNQSEGRGGRVNAVASESGRVRPNECGHISGNSGHESRSNNGRVSRGGGNEHTNRSNISQVNIDSGGGNKGPPNGEENFRDRGSRHGNLPDADQGYPKNKGGSRRSGGNNDLPTRGGSRGCSCGDGKSYNGGIGWHRNGGNPANLDCDTNGLRADGNYTRSNRGENATNYETGNIQGGEDGDWPGNGIAQEQDVPNGDSGGGGWNNGTGGNWNGNEGGCPSGPDGNDITDYRGGGNGEREGGGDNGEWDDGNNPNINPDTTNCDWNDIGHDNGNGDNADLGEFNNETNDPAGNAYNADETNNYKEPTPNPASNQQIDIGEATISNAPPAEPILSYAKPYWSSWTAESERVVSPTEPNTSRKRADSFHSGEELPLYSIHIDQLGDHSVRHQVRHGRPEYYARNPRKPVYIDTMAEPYAVFAFKYRSKQALEILLKVPIEDDQEYEKARLMRMPKDQIIQELLQMKASASSGFTRHNDNTSEENKDNTLGNDGGGAESGGDRW